jgi:hypothetical protein
MGTSKKKEEKTPPDRDKIAAGEPATTFVVLKLQSCRYLVHVFSSLSQNIKRQFVLLPRALPNHNPLLY